MQAELETRRRVLLVTYQRYLDADRAWTLGLREMKSWFPAATRPRGVAIGEPGSRMRALYEARARAISQLETARMKFETAKRRLALRRPVAATRVLVLTHSH